MFFLLKLIPLLFNCDNKDIFEYIFIGLIIFLVFIIYESTYIKQSRTSHLENLDFINKNFFNNFLNSKCVLFIFIFVLNLVLSYFMFEIVNNFFDSSSLTIEDIAEPRCPLGFTSSSCPFGFSNKCVNKKSVCPMGFSKDNKNVCDNINIEFIVDSIKKCKENKKCEKECKKEVQKCNEEVKEECCKKETKEDNLKKVNLKKEDLDIEGISNILKEEFIPKVIPKVINNLKQDLNKDNGIENMIENLINNF